jgi:glycosyltransferase involved in cell wall biosynthesis
MSGPLIARLLARLGQYRLRPRLRAAALFDAPWYLRRYPDLPPGTDAALHYLAHGAAEGRDPGPGFSTSGYLVQCRAAGLELAGENPLLHYQRQGAAAGLSGLPSLTGGRPQPGAPVLLFVAHQALPLVFGAERSFLQMLDRAAAAGLAVEVVLPQALNEAYLAQVCARARRVHLCPFGWRQGTRPGDPVAVAALRRLIAQSGAVELHQNTLVLDTPLLAARAAGIASVVHIRELPAQDPELCARLGLSAETLRDALLAQGDRFVANSRAVADWIAPPDGPDGTPRCLTLPNSIDAGLFELPFQPGATLRIGLISSNIAKKGLADLLAVGRRWADQTGVPPLAFRLIGPATPDLARLSPLPANVQALGYRDTPAQALAEVDILLSLSGFAESFGRTVYEAMAAGRPVICYDRGTPPALVRPQAGSQTSGGQVVPADDPGGVVQALQLWAASPARLQQASQAARLRAMEIRAQTGQIRDTQLYAAAFTRR